MPDNIFPDQSNSGFDIKYNQLKILASDIKSRAFNQGVVGATPVSSPQTGTGGGNDNPIPPNDGCKKVYVANLTQSGTDAPTAEAFENTIGPIVWTRLGAGQYKGTLIGAFPSGLTWVMVNKDSFVDSDSFKDIRFLWLDEDSVTVRTHDVDGGSLTDGLLDITSIEIRTYCGGIVITPPCVPATGSIGEMPDALAGNPYSYSVALSGTPPFVLRTPSLPSWMFAEIVNVEGTYFVEFSGTPTSDDAGEDISVHVTVSNCTASTLDLEDTISVTGAEPSEIIFDMDRQSEGGTLALTFEFSTGLQSGTVDWGDGSSPETFTSSGISAAASHTYGPAGKYRVVLTFSDASALTVFSDFSGDPSYVSGILFGSGFTGSLTISINHGRLTSIPVFPATASTLFITDMPLFTGVLDISNIRGIVELDSFPNVTGMTAFPASLTQLFISNMDALLTMPAIPNTMGGVQIQNMPVMTGFGSATIGTGLGYLLLFDVPSFDQLLILPSGLQQLQLFECNLTGAILPTLPASLTSVDLESNVLSSANCDTVFEQLVTNGQSAGTVNTSSQTPPATLGSGGLAAETTLISRGWSTTHD